VTRQTIKNWFTMQNEYDKANHMFFVSSE